MKIVSMRSCVILMMAVALSLVSGCSERENPLLPQPPTQGLVFDAVHEYNGLLDLPDPSWAQFTARHVTVYAPSGYRTWRIGFRYPVLYLLPGYDGEAGFQFDKGNENYYQVANIAKVADRLIASGEIKPLLIVMPDASIWYGGAFYANSSLAGNWEDMMALELVDYIEDPDTVRFRTIGTKETRAVSGHSSGGYGAMRITMKYPDLFNSVSCIDAPLAFSGDGDFGGITDMFEQYLTESGINSQDDYINTDTIGFRSQPVKLLLYSMAATFTPTTKDPTTPFGKLSIALPFDYLGNTVDSLWNIWMANDLYSWLDGDSTYVQNLQDQNIHLEWSTQDRNFFNTQTELFSTKLEQVGINHSFVTFSGFDGGYDAQSRSFLYDRIEEILKFHDQYLKDRYGHY